MRQPRARATASTGLRPPRIDDGRRPGGAVVQQVGVVVLEQGNEFDVEGHRRTPAVTFSYHHHREVVMVGCTKLVDARADADLAERLPGVQREFIPLTDYSLLKPLADSQSIRYPNPMWIDLVDLRDFYDRRLGQVARHLIRRRVRAMWPRSAPASLLGIGYRHALSAPATATRPSGCCAIMPAGQGVLAWPPEGPNAVALAEETELPLPDMSHRPGAAGPWRWNAASRCGTCCARSGA